MGKKAIVAGHICLDITPVFPEGKSKNVEDLLKPGHLIQMNEADVHTGGAVANTGLAMKILGADVSLMGKIGDDAFGQIVLNILKKYDAQSGMIVSKTDSTSYSVVLAIPGLDRIFLHNPGANNTFSSSDIPEKTLSESALVHFGYPPLMKRIYENQGEELLKLMRRIKQAGAATSLDLAAVDSSSEAGKVDWKAILTKILPDVDFFVPSVEELCYMLDRGRFESWQAKSHGCDISECLDLENDIKPLAKQCMELGCKVLLIKCGAPGLYYCTASKNILDNVGKRLDLDSESWANKEGFVHSFIPEKLLSGTGAGDTCIAAFLTTTLKGYPLKKCVELAAATGACCVTSYDALSGLKSFEQLDEKIKSGWAKSL